MTGMMAVGCILIAVAFGLGLLGNLSVMTRASIVLACLLAGSWGIYFTVKSGGKTHHIDISGIGQIRLVEDYALAASTFSETTRDFTRVGELVSLMDDSILWSFLLLLRFRDERRQVKTLIVFPDSVGRDVFRMLSVACRWIAAHKNPAERTYTKNIES